MQVVCFVHKCVGNFCMKSGIACFGPRMQAAKIESSKEFAKQFMSRFNLPTAKWRSFTDAREACQFIRRLHSCFLPVCFLATSVGLALSTVLVLDFTSLHKIYKPWEADRVFFVMLCR